MIIKIPKSLAEAKKLQRKPLISCRIEVHWVGPDKEDFSPPDPERCTMMSLEKLRTTSDEELFKILNL
jgi:hypothetical protein